MPGAAHVLVHGAWHGAWCWRRIVAPLQAAGHAVFAVTLTGLGERSHLLSREVSLETHIRDVVNVLEWEDLHDVVLVGHSYGGVIASGVADRLPERIGRIVFLDAALLENGGSAVSMWPRHVRDVRLELAQAFSGGWLLPAPEPAAFGVVDPDDAAWLVRRCTPHPMRTFEDKLVLSRPVGCGRPVTYVAVKPDYVPLAACRAFARVQPGWRYLEIDAGHDAMVTSPREVVDILRA